MKIPGFRNYILIGQTAVPEPDFLKYAEWFGQADVRVALTQVGPYEVSTVFLGHDHGVGLTKKPLLFETMVFCDGEGLESDHCSTWLEAEQMHQRIVEEMKARLVSK